MVLKMLQNMSKSYGDCWKEMLMKEGYEATKKAYAKVCKRNWVVSNVCGLGCIFAGYYLQFQLIGLLSFMSLIMINIYFAVKMFREWDFDLFCDSLNENNASDNE